MPKVKESTNNAADTSLMEISSDSKINVAIYIKTKSPWYMRLWIMLSNPFTYLFTGIWRK